jgi:D-sedoheptulose 7-phosphate isomerase
MNTIEKIIQASIDVKTATLNNKTIISDVQKIVDMVATAFKNGNKVLFCGNGGSAADAQHLAAEFSGRFYSDRVALPAEALHVNTSYLTAVANDYSFDVVYSRLIKGIGKPGDVLFGISTSGNSKNIINAFVQAKENGMQTISFTGLGGGIIKKHSDFTIAIESDDTPRIQECHILIGHVICQLVEENIFNNA